MSNNKNLIFRFFVFNKVILYKDFSSKLSFFKTKNQFKMNIKQFQQIKKIVNKMNKMNKICQIKFIIIKIFSIRMNKIMKKMNMRELQI